MIRGIRGREGRGREVLERGSGELERGRGELERGRGRGGGEGTNRRQDGLPRLMPREGGERRAIASS